MLTLSGIAGHRKRSWGFSTSERTRVIVFFHQLLPSENKTETRRKTWPPEKPKKQREAGKDETGGKQFCF